MIYPCKVCGQGMRAGETCESCHPLPELPNDGSVWKITPPTGKADRIKKILANLIPREQFTFCRDRSTNNKRHCFDCPSRSEEGVVRRQSYDLQSDSWWCSCPGFTRYGRCAHTDSLRYWMAYRTASIRLAQEDTAYLTYRSRQLLGTLAEFGLRLEAHAELDAAGDLLAERVALGLAA